MCENEASPLSLAMDSLCFWGGTLSIRAAREDLVHNVQVRHLGRQPGVNAEYLVIDDRGKRHAIERLRFTQSL